MTRCYELTINTKSAVSLLEKVSSYLPSPAVKERKSSSFLTLEFYAEPEKIQELEKKLKQDALRYLILTKPPTTFRKKRVEEIPTIPRKKAAGGKVELAEIEKKLEEILNE